MRRTEQEWEEHRFHHETQADGLQAYVIKRLKEHSDAISGCKVMRANINGVCDLILNVQGRYVAIELKVGDNEPTLHQEKFIEWVSNTKGISGVAYTWGQVKDIIRCAGYDIDEAVAHGKGQTDIQTRPVRG